jgi:hypothetical protein
MVQLINNFNGGPDSTDISTANSGQQGDDAFDVVSNAGSTGILKFAGININSLNRPTAEFAMRLADGNQVAQPVVGWGASLGTQAEIWTRFYMYYSTVVTTNASDLNLFSTGTAGVKGVGLFLQTSSTPRVLYLSDHTTPTARTALMATPLVSSQWTRVELHVACDASAGSAELYYYANDDVDTDVYTDMVSQTGANYTSSTCDAVYLGQILSQQKNIPNIFFSNWEVNTTGFPGPAPFRAGKGVPGILTNPIAIHMA